MEMLYIPLAIAVILGVMYGLLQYVKLISERPWIGVAIPVVGMTIVVVAAMVLAP